MLNKVSSESQRTAITQGIAKVSRIYQAGANMIQATRSMFDSTQSMLDTSIEHTGLIGNAIRDAKLVAEDAYDEMVERVTPKDKSMKALQRFRDGLELAEDAVNSVGNIISDARDGKEAAKELKEGWAEVREEIEDDKKARKEEREEIKEDSRVKAEIAKADFDKAPPEEG